MNPVHEEPRSASAGTLVPSVVSDIPVAAPGAPQKPADDDQELDKIMRDVGKDIKDIGQKKPKHHWFAHNKKPRADPKFSARPIDQIKTPPVPSRPEVKPALSSKTPQKPAAQPAAKKPIKPAKTSAAPVGVILLAVIITGALIAAAFYAYKKAN